MKAFYDRFYKISDNENISDRVMIFRIILSVSMILLCLFGMTFIACAYYEYDLSYRIGDIRSAVFDVDVAVSYTDGSGTHPVEVVKSSDGQFWQPKSQLDQSKVYTVTITRADAATAKTGFCVVYISGTKEQKCHTVQLESGSPANSVTFKLSLTRVLKIIPNWGTSSSYPEYVSNAKNLYYITDGKYITCPS